jgi:hypothetical protein
MAPTSASTEPYDDGLAAAMEASPLHWDGVQQYSASGTSTPEPLLPPTHWQEVLGALAPQRGSCCRVHPTVSSLPSRRRTTSSSVVVVDIVVLRRAHGAQELLHPMSAFLKTHTCSVVVRPLACAFREEETRSVRACPRDE